MMDLMYSIGVVVCLTNCIIINSNLYHSSRANGIASWLATGAAFCAGFLISRSWMH